MSSMDKIRCKLEKVGDRGYRVLRLKDGKWQVWLENETYDRRDQSRYKAYYTTPEAAKRAAAEAAEAERKAAVDSQEFEV